MEEVPVAVCQTHNLKDLNDRIEEVRTILNQADAKLNYLVHGPDVVEAKNDLTMTRENAVTLDDLFKDVDTLMRIANNISQNTQKITGQ